MYESRSGRLFGCAIQTFTFACAFAARAYAHDPPEINRIVWNPARDRIALVTNRGLILGGPERWQLLCGAAIGASDVEPVDVVYVANGGLVAATSQGLRVSRDPACQWDWVTPFMNTFTSALAQHPTELDTIYVGVSAVASGGIHVSRDGGATWSQVLVLPSESKVSRVMVANPAPARIYATVLLRRASGDAHVLFRSSDAGKTWEQLPLTLRSTETHTSLLAVSPVDSETLLVLAVGREPGTDSDRVLVSRDGGRSFLDLWTSVGIRDATFDADGRRAWIAGLDGLYRTDAAIREVTALGEAQLMTCVVRQGGALYACGHHSGFDPVAAGVGLSSDQGETFQRWMAFTGVGQQVSCPPGSNTVQACGASWSDWQLEILVSLGGAPISILDAGPPAAGTGGAAPAAGTGGAAPAAGTGGAASPGAPVPSKESGCAVAIAAGSDGRFCAWLVGIAVAVSMLRRRRLTGSGSHRSAARRS